MSGEPAPRMRLVHLLTEPDAERERRSVASVAPLAACGIEYVPVVNEPYRETPPRDGCARPRSVTSLADACFPNEWQLGPGHYGCFLAHRDAVAEHFTAEVDLFVVAECDCILTEPAPIVAAALVDAVTYAREAGAAYLSLGNGWDGPAGDGFVGVPAIFRTHLVVFPAASRGYLRRAFAEQPWDTIDYWYNAAFASQGMAIARRPYAMQAAGPSLLEGVVREGV